MYRRPWGFPDRSGSALHSHRANIIRQPGAAHEKTDDDVQWVVRFAPVHRLTHVLIVVSFLTLVATGLPLMFYYTNWAQILTQLWGGVTVTRFMSRPFSSFELAAQTLFKAYF